MVVVTRSLYHDSAGLTALTPTQTGTHFLATIPPNHALSASAHPSRNELAVAMSVVIRGEIEIAQGQEVASAASGALSTWDARADYSLENRHQDEAVLLIFLPSGCSQPALASVGALDDGPVLRPRYAPPLAEGPLRLVAMRAQRQAARRR